jgi:hypothetical protein
MGLLVIYALFVTFYAVGMTIEYARVVSYKRGYEEGYTDAKKNCYQDCGFDEGYKPAEEDEHCGHGQCCR